MMTIPIWLLALLIVADVPAALLILAIMANAMLLAIEAIAERTRK